MQVAKTLNELKFMRNKLEGRVGFVPTMGALHNGHISLIRKSVEENPETIVSIFVNPSQFSLNEDFNKYPENLEKDLEKCRKAGAALVFTPDRKEIYKSEKPCITFNINSDISSILCGKNRLGHFEGVVQIVVILFNLVNPDVAYFGEKDFQQLRVIRKMVENLHFQIEIRSVPTVRETNGLAMSSRNIYLSDKQKELASQVYKTMETIQRRAEDARLERRAIPVEFAENEAKKRLVDQVPDIEIEYIEIRNNHDLSKSRFLSNNSKVFISVKIDGTRLIDNLFLGKKGG